jgi:hypothetical protein
MKRLLRDEEYVRLQTIFLAIAKHSDQPHDRARWLALGQACREELLTARRNNRSSSLWA